MDLKNYYEEAFGASAGEIYGSASGWTVVQRSGHFRRMTLLDEAPLPPLENATAVDFGMGAWGFASVFPRLRTAARCVGIDISNVALQMSREKDVDIRDRSDYLQSELSGIPLPDASVDVFWGGEVLEHVQEPREFLQEIARVCKDGAHVLLSTPNRDALLYRVDGQDYAIGPEHIALLNADELVEMTDLFFETVALQGYETSIAPDFDASMQDEHIAEALQRRATAFPELASGLIYHGVNRADRYRRNALKWSRTDFPWDADSIRYSAEPVVLDLAGPLKGAGLAPGASASASVRARKYVLFLWAHDWSGEAEITIGDERRVVDLFSKGGGFKRVEFAFADDAERPVVVRRTGMKSPRSSDSQVILHALLALHYGPVGAA